MVRVILAVILSVLLAACSLGAGAVSSPIVERAIALQFRQTQQEILQQLASSPDQQPTFQVDRVAIAHRERFTLENLPTYRVRGTYRLTLHFPRRAVVEPRSPFEVYVQRQPEGKTWRLVRPLPSRDPGEPDWATYLIPMD